MTCKDHQVMTWMSAWDLSSIQLWFVRNKKNEKCILSYWSLLNSKKAKCSSKSLKSNWVFWLCYGLLEWQRQTRTIHWRNCVTLALTISISQTKPKWTPSVGRSTLRPNSRSPNRRRLFQMILVQDVPVCVFPLLTPSFSVRFTNNIW